MGYLRGTVCYSTFAEWEDAVYGAIPPTYTPGSTSYEGFFQKDSTLGWRYCRAALSSTAVRSGLSCGAVPVSSTGVATCAPEAAFLDGAALGFGVAAVILVVWGAVVLARQLR